LPFFTLVRITVPAFYAYKDTKTPALVSLTSVLVNVLLCLYLREQLGFAGLALAAALAGMVNISLLTFLLRRKIRISEDLKTLGVLVRIILSALGMGAAIYLARPLLLPIGGELLPNNIVGLSLLLVLGLAVFLTLALLFRIEEMQRLSQYLREKLNR
jgi:putative peptidoglycan lipid II flippase